MLGIGPSQGIAGDSHPLDYVFALGKSQLRSLCLELKKDLEVARSVNDHLRFELEESRRSFNELVGHNEKRFDDLLEEKLNRRVVPLVADAQKQIAKPQSWREIKSSFEGKQRAEYWAKKIEDMEKDVLIPSSENVQAKDIDPDLKDQE